MGAKVTGMPSAYSSGCWSGLPFQSTALHLQLVAGALLISHIVSLEVVKLRRHF